MSLASVWLACAGARRGPGVGTSQAAIAAHPFPAHATYPSDVILPSVPRATMDATVQTFYATWVTTYVRVVPGSAPAQKYIEVSKGRTVSEAHGYGMVLAAYMGDRSLVDALFRYYKAHPSSIGPHLMAWQQQSEGGRMIDSGGDESATDGDLDLAYALLVADAQWGSRGPIAYRTEALAILGDVVAHEINPVYWNPTPGDWATGPHREHTRTSDFMLDHFLAFAAYDTAHTAEWNNIYACAARIVNLQFQNGSKDSGLVPDFMVFSGGAFVPVTGQYLESPHDGDFNWNSCRTPWRLAMPYLVAGKVDVLAAQRRTNTWIRGRTGGVPANIRAGYYVRNGVNGEPYVDYNELAFTAPMTVNAMLGGPSGQAWLDSLWTSITSITDGDFPSVSGYFGDAIRMQVLLAVSGNWWLPSPDDT